MSETPADSAKVEGIVTIPDPVGDKNGATIRVLVTGSRTWTDEALIWTALDEAVDELTPQDGTFVIVHGCAKGADTMASRWVEAQREQGMTFVSEERHPAEWDRLGKGDVMADYQCNYCDDSGDCVRCSTFFEPDALHSRCGKPWKAHTSRGVETSGAYNPPVAVCPVAPATARDEAQRVNGGMG